MSGMEFYRRLSMGMPIDRCYDLEFARLESFSKRPQNFLPNISYIKLAAAGFYFDNGQCKCFECGIIWTGTHCDRHCSDLLEVHRQISPYCQFVCNGTIETPSGNGNCISIGIRRSIDVESHDEPRSEETNTKERPGTQFSGLLDTGYSSFALSRPFQEEEQPSIIQSSHQCSNVEDSHNDFIYTDYNVRLASFRNWPKTQTPVDLAGAGFFYTGKNDVVKCYSCGIRLGEWEPHEHPWMEHSKHSPECDFVKIKMPNRETHNLLTEQPSPSSEEYGAIANPTEDVVTEFDNPSSRVFSTKIISDNDIDLYMESPAAFAVLHTWSTKPNIKQLVKETLIALCHDKQCKPSAEKIARVVWLLEERDKKIKELKEYIQSLESDAANRSAMTKCGICLTEERTIVCCPCGHFFCCAACSDRLQLDQNPRCPLCRHAVDRFVKMFWA
ncbi:baculoviral IAP repeat-containing protein 7-B-like [Mytilus trossulus]|uniref:baculoviral IAP repeat-containing protein 7-B-like n=1 Tax=Mytilus trossulus TaxID=6551 RepID=UPI0030071EDD